MLEGTISGAEPSPCQEQAPACPRPPWTGRAKRSIRASAPGGAGAQCEHLTGHHLAFCSSGTDAVGAKVGSHEPCGEKISRGIDGSRSQGRSWPAIRGDKGPVLFPETVDSASTHRRIREKALGLSWKRSVFCWRPRRCQG